MDNVISICTPDLVFTLEEADQMIPLIEKIVKRSEEKITDLQKRYNYLAKCGVEEADLKKLEVAIGTELISSGTKLTKLGLKVFGMNYIGFNSGFGYWSWYPGDKTIEYYHDYLESPVFRRKLTRGLSEQVKAETTESVPKA